MKEDRYELEQGFDKKYIASCLLSYFFRKTMKNIFFFIKLKFIEKDKILWVHIIFISSHLKISVTFDKKKFISK